MRERGNTLILCAYGLYALIETLFLKALLSTTRYALPKTGPVFYPDSLLSTHLQPVFPTKFKATPHNSSAALAMPFSPSAACRFLDLPPVNLRNLQLHLTKNSFATAPTHLCGVALTIFYKTFSCTPRYNTAGKGVEPPYASRTANCDIRLCTADRSLSLRGHRAAVSQALS